MAASELTFNIKHCLTFSMSTFVESLSLCLSLIIFWLFLPISFFICFQVVREYERVIIFRLGRLKENNPYGPGFAFVLPCIDTEVQIDLRTYTIDIYPQEILSKDQVTVRVNAIAYYYVFDPMLTVTKVNDYKYSTTLLGATILRNVLGTCNLTELLIDRKNMSETIQKQLDVATDPWGVKIVRVELKDIKLPPQMQRSMAQEAEAAREAKAKVISAEGELKASEKLKEASDILSQGSMSVQLRYLQTLITITAQKKSTILFPIPINILPPDV